MELNFGEHDLSYYPHKSDPNFIQILTSKKEFKDSTIKYPVSKNKEEILKNSSELCNKENVILLPQQEFLKILFHQTHHTMVF